MSATTQYGSTASWSRRSSGWPAWRRQLMTWWFGLPEALRSPTWPTALACLTILALVLGFHEVVTMAVRQGELLRMNTATRADAVWRCHALRGQRMQASCLEQLDAAPAEHVNAAPPPNTAALHMAQAGR